ncbi:MAG: ArsA family ATPase [Acidimicrobiia bacterium]|nr:TRC40/GET3/ArsA family transport-energizing ATPase [Acidimicrobiia bacterium]MBT8215571.1 TRC40/GET3/ArsA family transport-energizing ATPase [Acidimicrobiia bacterium]NNF11258.1 ArsA family ATPase [Acidimicrobiia bacterium]NNL68993.1 ArsA family ATPase [Acidimicrobiia bacterium]
MRVLLVTGKGGVGKTTVAAATALKAADRGHRTLVMSTDPAHSLADAFNMKLGDEPIEVSDNLVAQQIDSQHRLEQYWGEVREYLTDLFDWSGLRGIEAEELSVFPGMDELFALADVKDHAVSGTYDLLVVDCAPTAETLRLLSLPEILGWYMDKIFPVERKVVKAMRPVLSKVVSIPIAGDEVFDAAEGFYGRIQGVRDILTNPFVTSARLVLNPEKMVINEARRTYTYLGLFGYAVDGVVVNRVLPDAITDPYFKRWQEVQAEYLEDIEDGFADVDIRRLRLFDEEMVGVDKLRLLGDELYGDIDPTSRLSDSEPFQVLDDGDDVVLAMAVPFADKSEVDVVRYGEELIITVGTYRRAFILPDSLRRRVVRRAKLEGGVLRVTFGEPG